jgi:hypothetical protein
MVGCGRLGFGLAGQPNDQTPDAGAGALHAHDAASGSPANLPDAGSPAASARDAATTDAASGAMDAALADAATVQDAQTRDAGSSDASASDAAVPNKLCPERSDALFCDGFEDPKLARWSYTIFMMGMAERATSPVHTGMGSLHATTGAAGMTTNNASRYGAKPYDHQKSGDVWLRYYYYVPSSVVVNSYFSSGVVAEIEKPYFGFSLIILPDHVEIESGGTRFPGTMSFPRDHWTCVELHVQIDPAVGVFEAYLDGTLAVHSSPTKTQPAHGYASADVGIHYTDLAQGPVEVYVDDVVASLTRVGCN